MLARQQLSDTDLLRTLTDLACTDRQLERQIIEHLMLVQERELHIKMAYASLFEFARQYLRASESTTFRRLKIMRAARRFPVMLDYLGDGRLTMTALSMVAAIMNDENHAEALDQAVGKSTRELEKMIADRNPKPATADVMRRVEVAAFKMVEAPTAESASAVSDRSVGSALVLMRETVKPDAFEHKGGGRVRMSFDAGEATAQKIERLKELCRHRCPEARLEDIIDLACEALLEQVAPERRVERRRKKAERKAMKAARAGAVKGAEREEAKSSLKPESSSAETKAVKVEEAKPTDSMPRHASRALRDEASVAAGGCCEYVAKDGRRCGARAWGQVDHVRPWALGGGSEKENLRYYCFAHNQYAARESFGVRARAGAIAERRGAMGLG